MEHSSVDAVAGHSLVVFSLVNSDEENTQGPSNLTGLPPLCYDIASKKNSLIVNWTFILVCNAIIPLALYYALRYGTNLDQVTVISIAEIPMNMCLFQWPYRMWQLLRNNGERAPRDRTLWTLDSFQWQFAVGIFLVGVLCIVSSVIGSIRLLTLGPIVLFGEVAVQLVLTAWMYRAGVRTPCRISSQPAGTVARPGVYYIVEDLTACDGAGGTQYRDRVNQRYESSLLFRELMYDLSFYLGIGFSVMTAAQIALIVVAPGEVSYGVSTALLWGWSGLSAWWGVWYTTRALALEKVRWEQNAVKGGMEKT